jgi:hypothetical protein
LLLELEEASKDFEYAVGLFDHIYLTVPNPDYAIPWPMIVGTQAMLYAWHFGEALKEIDRLLRRHCPTLLEAMGGKNTLKPVIGLFGAQFRDLEDFRNSDAHKIDRVASQGGWREAELAPGVLLNKSLSGRRILISKHKRELAFEVSVDSLGVLLRIRDTVFKTLREAASKLSPPETSSP